MSRTGMAFGWALGIAGLVGTTALAQAAEFCCTCRGQTTGKTITANDEVSASFDCTLACKRPTRPKPGACAAPPAAAPAAPAAPAAAGVPVNVALYTSDDCSGEPRTITASSPKLADQGIGGVRSFSVVSGPAAAAFEKPGYTGAATQPVAASLCVSPGWEVAAVRVQGQ
jgi:hypothetical protein